MRFMSGGLRAAALGGSRFSPLSLSPFIWLDPSDLSTLFQDAAMTTPVTADSDPVGAILDKSGNGRHPVQATAGSRPLYRTAGGLHWLQFDGSDDFMQVDFGSTVAQPLEHVCAFRFISVSGFRYVVDLGEVSGSQCSLISDDDGSNIAIHSGSQLDGAAIAAGTDYVGTARFNGASSRVALDNGEYTTGQAGTAVAGGCTIGVRVDTAQDANIRFYGNVAFGRLLTDPEIAQLRTYLAGKQGRVL